MKNKIDPFVEELNKLVDDSVTDVYIETPEGWKCERCSADYKHTHGTYPCPTPKNN